MSNTMITMIWELAMSALIILALLFSAIAVVVGCTCPRSWNDVLVEPWAKEERREAKRKAKAAEHARREFWGIK